MIAFKSTVENSMSPAFFRVYKKVVLVLLFIIGIIWAYDIGFHRVDRHFTNDPLVQIVYSGGWYTGYADPVAFVALYDDGYIYQVTNVRRWKLIKKISRSEVMSLRDDLNETVVLETFVKKEREFCSSAVDGVDREIRFRLNTGEIVQFSDCIYDFEATPLVQEVHELLRVQE